MGRKKKDPRRKPQVITPEDYGIDYTRGSQYGVTVVTGGAKPREASTGLLFEGANLISGVNTSTIKDPAGNPLTPEGKPLEAPDVPLSSQNFMSEKEIEQAKRAPDLAQQELADQTEEKSWIANLFDTSDTFDEEGNFQSDDLALLGGEALFDGVMRGLQWLDDRKHQLTVAGLSALPGGSRTLEWDEAGDVSFGQMIVGNAGISAGRVRRGEATAGDWVALLGGLPAIGAAVAATVDPDTPIQEKGWDITDPTDREVFNNGAERIFSTVGDFGFAFAEPALFVGWGAKAARLRYLDELIDTPAKLQKKVDGLQEGKRVFTNNFMEKADLPPGATVESALSMDDVRKLDIDPIAQFAFWTVHRGEDGAKATSFKEIFNHKVIKYSTNRDGLATALYNAETYDEASLILRHAMGDANARAELLARRPDVLKSLIDDERELVELTLRADPSKQEELIAQYSARMDKYDEELQWLKDNLKDDPRIDQYLDRVRALKDKTAKQWLAASNNKISIAEDIDIDLARRALDARIARDKALARQIDIASDNVNGGLDGALTSSVKGFSRKGAFGRAAEASRQRKAKAIYEVEATRGAHLWQSTDFAHLNTAKGKFKRAIRVWRYFGMESPSGIVRIAGVGAQESTREVDALLNSLRMYGREGKFRKMVDGQEVEIDGLTRKNEILTEYANAISRGGVEGQDAAALALKKMEETVKEDMIVHYGMNKTAVDEIFAAIDGERATLADNIRNKKFWVDDDKNSNVAPYLETHLQGADLQPNYRAIERKFIQSLKEQNSSLRAGADWVEGRTADLYNNFQSLWRPAVLLRLGYTQRNVAEGLFRSMAFQFSLAPLGLAAKQGWYSGTNVGRAVRYGSKGTRGAVEQARVAARTATSIDQMPKAFRAWHAKQVDAISEQIAQNHDIMMRATRELAEENQTWRIAETKRLNAQSRRLSSENQTLRTNRPENLTEQQADLIIERNTQWLNTIYERLNVMSGMKGGATGELDEAGEAIAQNLQYFDESVQPMLSAQAAALDDPVLAAATFRNQTLAKRRNYQGQGNVSDPKTLREAFMGMQRREAFDPTDSYSNIALANLSADHTTRQVMALRMDTTESLFFRKIQKYNVEVQPGAEGYWDGLAVMLNQWVQSDVGTRIIRDIADGRYTDEEIATRLSAFLRNDSRGREIASFISKDTSSAGVKAYSVRAAKAQEKAEAAAAPLLEAANRAKDEIDAAKEMVRWAKRDLKERQKADPRVKALRDRDGKVIKDEAAYVQRRKDAFAKARTKYESAVEDAAKKEMEKATPPAGVMPRVPDVEDTMAYALEMVSRYRRLTAGNTVLQKYLAGVRGVSDDAERPMAEFARLLEDSIGPAAKTADGQPYELIPVVGNAAEQVMSRKFLETMQAASAVAFKWMGTIPEDLFVRAPFYGRRFQRTYDELVRNSLAQMADDAVLSPRKIAAIRETAHRRALKDTKDWLYTIDRRTLMGQYGEAIFPFISAFQNSVTAVGRMIWNDPRVAALMGMIWNAPTRAGLEDSEGRMHFSLPLEWIPEGVREAVGLDAMMDFTFSKQQFNLIAPPTGFGGALPIPTPGPAVVVPFSEMMKHEFLGIGPAAPDALAGIVGQETADQMWDVFKSYMFGSDEDFTGMSTQPLSIDKTLPAWTQKLVQFMQGEGSSSAYTSWYDKIYQSEYLKWAQGYRDEPPTPSEISDKTRNFYFMRMGLNLAAFTPPGFTSEITPIADAARKIYETEPDMNLANQKIYELFGPTIQQIMRQRTTESVAGLDPTVETYRLAKDHADLIGTVAPILANNNTLNVIGLLGPTSRGEYDPSFSAAQQLSKIPNTDRYFREVQNPAQAAIDAQISAGWSQYIKNMDRINAVLAQRGLKSLRSKGAQDLMALKREMVDRLANDPRYAAWYGDYIDGVSSRTNDSVMLMENALSNPKFRDTYREDPIWGYGGAVEQYMNGRDQTMELLSNAERIEDTKERSAFKKQVKEQWAAFRSDLANRFPDWAAKQERYLSGDDDPDQPQIILVTDFDDFTPQEGAPVPYGYEGFTG